MRMRHRGRGGRPLGTALRYGTRLRRMSSPQRGSLMAAQAIGLIVPHKSVDAARLLAIFLLDFFA